LNLNQTKFFVNFGDRDWRQSEAWILLRAEASEVSTVAQGRYTATHSVAVDPSD